MIKSCEITCSFIKKVGWDAELVNESYPWIENQIVFQPQLSLWQKAVRDGLLEAGVSPFHGFTYDHKYGTKVGGTIFDRFGRRHTAAELLASANPENIDVLVHATVQKIEFDTAGTLLGTFIMHDYLFSHLSHGKEESGMGPDMANLVLWRKSLFTFFLWDNFKIYPQGFGYLQKGHRRSLKKQLLKFEFLCICPKRK